MIKERTMDEERFKECVTKTYNSWLRFMERGLYKSRCMCVCVCVRGLRKRWGVMKKNNKLTHLVTKSYVKYNLMCIQTLQGDGKM